MKKIFITIILCFVCTICSSCFLSFGSQKSEDEIARDRIISLTKIEVPVESKIVYHSREATEFVNGRRAMYTVFEFESEPTDWLNENSFDKEKSFELEKEFLGGFDMGPVKIEEIPKEFLPDFESEYYYLKVDKFIYFVYVPQRCTLAVLIPGY